MTDWIGVGTISTPSTGLGTISRATLRREICRELHMPFMRKYNGALTVDASPAPTTTSISCTSLTQEKGFWEDQWWFSINHDETRLIVDFEPASNKLTFEYPGTLPKSGDLFEIHTIWNANEIHGAINRAIEDAYPSFFDVVTDETLILREDTLNYDLSSLTYVPWIMTKVWVENPASIMRGIVSSAAAGTLIDSSAVFTGVDSSYVVSIYAGTGAGQIRAISSITGTTQLNLASDWTTTPDTTSKYAVWDTSEQLYDWTRLQNVRFNSKENPTKIYLPSNYSAHVGVRIRLEYISKPITMTTEASVTGIPKEFLIHRALYFLYSQKINDNRADRQRYELLAQRHFEQSELYKQSHAFNMPEMTMWTPSVHGRFDQRLDGDPIGWSYNGY